MNKKILAALLLMCFSLLFQLARAADDPVVTHKVEGKFHEVAANLRSAILGKGINIAHMLRRTGASYGYTSDVYEEAETYEFCSAEISHKLSRLNPDNIVMCPFTISVYSLLEEPGMVRLSYRIPYGKPGTDDVAKEIVELIEGILEDVAW